MFNLDDELAQEHLAGLRDGPAGSQASQGDRPLRMLLVEDDFASRLLLRTFLSRYGECHIAVNGREAVEAFRSASERGQGYDLIRRCPKWTAARRFGTCGHW